MDRETILNDGLLEQYVLGELQPKQQLLVAEVLELDADLRKELNVLEENLEKIALENSVNPPAYIKTNLIGKIKSSETLNDSYQKGKVVELPQTKSNNWLFAAASIALIAVATTFFIYFSTNQKIESANAKITSLKKELENANRNNSNLNELIAFINQPETKKYIIQGNDLAPNSLVINYVNESQESVVIQTNQLKPLNNQDYQMWADVEGEMLNMGVIDLSKETLAMNYIKNAESFNITIEPKGGSKEPTVSKLIGSVRI